jgi:hypothetical protein
MGWLSWVSALRIHVSATTAAALENATGFHLSPRGEVRRTIIYVFLCATNLPLAFTKLFVTLWNTFHVLPSSILLESSYRYGNQGRCVLMWTNGHFNIFSFQVLLKGKGVMKTFWLDGCDDESHWRRARKLHSSSKDSIATKCSVNVNHHLYSHSPSYNITTICVTPAE